MLESTLRAELPFLASELLLMEAVRAGADRQDAHERLRVLAHQASEEIHAGRPNPLRDLIASDPLFQPLAGHLDQLLEPDRFVGRAPEQVLEYMAEEVDPLLAREAAVPAATAEVRV